MPCQLLVIMLPSRLLVLLILQVSLIYSKAYGQDHVMTLGFQVKPIFRNSFFNSGNFDLIQDSTRYTVKPRIGYSYGMLVRKGLGKQLSLETGISYVKRNYSFFVDDLDSSFSAKADFSIVEYEIPVSVLVFIRLSEKIFMNNSVGLSIDLFKRSEIETSDKVVYTFYRSTWIVPGLIANAGWEYRTAHAGYYYIGGSYQLPFAKVITMSADYYTVNSVETMTTKLGLGFFTFDIKFFFPPDRGK